MPALVLYRITKIENYNTKFNGNSLASGYSGKTPALKRLEENKVSSIFLSIRGWERCSFSCFCDLPLPLFQTLELIQLLLY